MSAPRNVDVDVEVRALLGEGYVHAAIASMDSGSACAICRETLSPSVVASIVAIDSERLGPFHILTHRSCRSSEVLAGSDAHQFEHLYVEAVATMVSSINRHLTMMMKPSDGQPAAGFVLMLPSLGQPVGRNDSHNLWLSFLLRQGFELVSQFGSSATIGGTSASCIVRGAQLTLVDDGGATFYSASVVAPSEWFDAIRSRGFLVCSVATNETLLHLAEEDLWNGLVDAAGRGQLVHGLVAAESL